MGLHEAIEAADVSLVESLVENGANTNDDAVSNITINNNVGHPIARSRSCIRIQQQQRQRQRQRQQQL
jgi:hypothetical protein